MISLISYGMASRLRLILGALILLGLTLLAQADEARILIYEDFESYTSTASMRSFWFGGTGELEASLPGGGKGSVHDGGEMNRHGGFAIAPDATHEILLSVDFYDFGTNTDRRVTLELRNTNSQTFDMGFIPNATYGCRTMGLSSRTNWASYKKGLPAVPGWHRFQARISLTNVFSTLDLGTDGSIDAAVNLPMNTPVVAFNQLRFGGLMGRPSKGGPVLVDNVLLAQVSPGGSVAVLPIAAAQPSPPVAAAAANSPNPNLPTTSPPMAPAVAPALPSAAKDKESYPSPVSTANASLSEPMTRALWWVFAALGLIIILLAVVLLVLRRKHAAPSPSQALVLSRPDTRLIGDGHGKGESSDQWRDRALQAEALASQQAEILKQKVGPELVEFAKETLVQGLYNQRNALVDTQRRAQAALEELESRLSELHLAPNERIQAYEKRVAELEKELETRSAEVRELSRATLLLVKQRLEQEREQKPGSRLN